MTDRRRSLHIALRVIVSMALLAGVILVVDDQQFAERLAALDPFWLVAALLVTVPQYLLSAARWQLTAGRLGAALPLGIALPEYYLAVFTNQVLPGGVVGDAARAVRHGRRLKARRPVGAYDAAIRAVIYERLSGQFALLLVLVPGLMAWPLVYDATAAAVEVALTAVLVTTVFLLVLALLLFGPLARTRAGSLARSFLTGMRHALLVPEVLVWQALYSFGVLATYLLCFYFAGRAIGFELTLLQVVTLVPAVFFAMTVPVSVGGWGIREATAAGVWTLAGFAAADGVAVSVAYGLIALLSALPGAILMLIRLRKRDVGNHG